jgi:choice-of-anchor B domain-containing protein
MLGQPTQRFDRHDARQDSQRLVGAGQSASRSSLGSGCRSGLRSGLRSGHRAGCLALAVGAMAAAALAPAALAHPDDPKVRDRMPRYEGPGWTAARAAAEGGVVDAGALGFDSKNVRLRAWLSLPDFGSFSSANDCWGYTSVSGREYAIIGLSSATAFVEITNPDDPQIVAVRQGPTSTWRDIKVYRHYAYAVSEGGQGIQVFDMSMIDQGAVTLVNTITSGGTAATHNVAINVASGYLYRCGGSNNGLRIYRLTNFPEGGSNPSYVTSWSTRYVHDAHIVTYSDGPYAGREIAFCCAGYNGGFVETGLTILDVTNKNNIQELAHLVYPQGVYSHQGWLTEDRRYFLLDDELDGSTNGSPSRTHVIDVQDLSNPTYQGYFTNGNTAATHNVYVVGNRMYAANYRSGLRVFDISDPLNGQEIAYFDTFPGSDSANFNGLWSNYPFFPSGTVIGSDMERGLFIWTIDDPYGTPLVGDLNGSCSVDADDLGILLSAFGATADGDLNGDGITDADDLGILLGVFGTSCDD